MKIICDNRKEYDELMEASEYLHYDVDDLDMNISMINMLAHLYVSENPELVVIKENK